MEVVQFGSLWFRAKKRLTEEWSEPRARTAHDQRLPYVAVLGDGEAVRCFVEASGDYFGIGFFDSEMREYLSYQFQEVEPGRLFLTMATHREFDAESDRLKCGTTYYFQPNGQLTIETEDFVTGQAEKSVKQIDVSGNWEAYPDFGSYAGLVRIER